MRLKAVLSRVRVWRKVNVDGRRDHGWGQWLAALIQSGKRLLRLLESWVLGLAAVDSDRRRQSEAGAGVHVWETRGKDARGDGGAVRGTPPVV